MSSSSDVGDSSGDESLNPNGPQQDVLAAYLSISSDPALPHPHAPDLSKIRSFLSRRRPSACLICLDPVRLADPVWPCSASCFAIFHLPCIQSWAHQSLVRGTGGAAAIAAPLSWPCPKCRFPYPRSEVPKKYLCFCGKVEDPAPDPWILPHSCGDVCGKVLSGDHGCSHRCLLLCHPGPCPPCPAVVPDARCFCGNSVEARRCARQNFSCGRRCGKLLECGLHSCREVCHDGACPPCGVMSKCSCECQKTEEERICAERVFRCQGECAGVLGCGKHQCRRGCHGGECGECPLRGRRTCPCGKKEYPGLDCDVEAPTCMSTCEKVLGCRRHKCPERCHNGSCIEVCRIMVTKSCRCGSLKKELPCYQDLACERKCQRLRDCGRHACKRRCCDGDCPPCPEICDKRLRCGNHKCPSPCHRGICSPCPLMVTISCFCGETTFEVPCGTEKTQKPPKCPKRCSVPRLCKHKLESRPHKCHYGACPPCRSICGEEFSCSHRCKERCHGPIPPPNPEFTLKPKKKKSEKYIECTPGSPCPPCQEIVVMSCFGQHIGEERSMPCFKKRQFPCQNLCGYLLACGNHYCTKSCHVLESSASLTSAIAEPCDECHLRCQKAREPPCLHPCPLACHPNDCPPCKTLVKRPCHCDAMVHVFECLPFNQMTYEEQQKVRSCGGPCHRKLSSCPHLCSEICHPGECPSSDHCKKKVTVRCSCNTVKTDWLCQDVQKAYKKMGRDPKEVTRSQFGIGTLSCGVDCAAKKVKAAESELNHRKSCEIEHPVAQAENVAKRSRKRRERTKQAKEIPVFQAIWGMVSRFLVIILIAVAAVVLLYLSYKGVYWLNDWMNALDRQRLRRGQPRF